MESAPSHPFGHGLVRRPSTASSQWSWPISATMSDQPSPEINSPTQTMTLWQLQLFLHRRSRSVEGRNLHCQTITSIGLATPPDSPNDLSPVTSIPERSRLSTSKLLPSQSLTTTPSTAPTASQWEATKHLIESLYLKQNMPLRDVMAVMQSRYGFKAT
jgi:hypothetical protein